MKVLVTGVAGQLGHDVMNELAKRGYEGIGSDLAPEYSGIADGTAVTTMPYVSMDITDGVCVERVLAETAPDAYRDKRLHSLGKDRRRGTRRGLSFPCYVCKQKTINNMRRLQL